jgi:ankyrin repeat protein
VQLLLEKGADVEVKDASGQMALHSAAQGGRQYKVVHQLLEKGANV